MRVVHIPRFAVIISALLALGNFSLTAQINFIKSSLHGDWILSTHFYTYQSVGSHEISVLNTSDKFVLLSFNQYDDTYTIRTGDSLMKQGKFDLVFSPLFPSFSASSLSKAEIVLLDLRDDKSIPLDRYLALEGNYWDSFVLTPEMIVASKDYAPGFCTAWDNYAKIGWGFLQMRRTHKNLRFVTSLVEQRRQIKWLETPKKANKQ